MTGSDDEDEERGPRRRSSLFDTFAESFGEVVEDALSYDDTPYRLEAIEATFRSCPFCGTPDGIRSYLARGLTMKDVVSCLDCGAVWHLKFGMLGGLKSVGLEKCSIDGKGRELLGQYFRPEYWQEMAIMTKRQRKTAEAASSVVVEREVTREIVKIPCNYCGGLVNEVDNFCKYCGAPRQGLRRTERISHICSKCGRSLTWIEKYSRWYCFTCRNYQ